MLPILVLRAALWTLSLMCGGIGVFLAIVSCWRPAFALHALVLVGAALAINYSLSH